MANVLKNKLPQGNIVKFATAVDVIDGAVLQQGIEAAAAETEWQVGAVETFVIMPDSQIVGDAVILYPLFEGADGEFRPAHKGGAFVEGAVVVDHQIVFKLDDTGCHGRLKGSKPPLQSLTP